MGALFYNRGLLTDGDTYQIPIPIHSNKQNIKKNKTEPNLKPANEIETQGHTIDIQCIVCFFFLLIFI